MKIVFLILLTAMLSSTGLMAQSKRAIRKASNTSSAQAAYGTYTGSNYKPKKKKTKRQKPEKIRKKKNGRVTSQINLLYRKD